MPFSWSASSYGLLPPPQRRKTRLKLERVAQRGFYLLFFAVVERLRLNGGILRASARTHSSTSPYTFDSGRDAVLPARSPGTHELACASRIFQPNLWSVN